MAIVDLNVGVLPRAAVALGLIFHELATNAAKYGALSRDGGRVSIRSSGTAEEGALRVEWVESGGPQVSPPSKRGFGRTVISRSLGYSANGGAEIDFRPEGVVCVIRIPGEDLR